MVLQFYDQFATNKIRYSIKSLKVTFRVTSCYDLQNFLRYLTSPTFIDFFTFNHYVSIITEKKFRKGPNKIIQIPSVPSIPLTFTNVMC